MPAAQHYGGDGGKQSSSSQNAFQLMPNQRKSNKPRVTANASQAHYNVAIMMKVENCHVYM